MATTAGCESSPPPTKRPKIADDYPGSGPNLDQSQFEPAPQISGISKAGLGEFLGVFQASRQIFFGKVRKSNMAAAPT